MIYKLQRLFHTLKYLKPTQLAFFILRRKFPAKAVRYSGQPEIRQNFNVSEPNFITGTGSGRCEFQFLNIKNIFPDEVDWAPLDVSRLWRYNLHYFDYLRDDARNERDKLALMQDWIARNPQGSQPGWEPFTTSLRIVNWIFFIARYREAQSNEILQSLYTQVLWLEKNDERHILANHYFENLKALAFAGAFFSGDDANRWLNRAIREVTQQFDEQILPDGGHYERTPQYHGLMLENFLDLYNLTTSNTVIFPASFTEKCLLACERGLYFLQAILFPDNSIPLLNDSAFGISPTFAELNAYFQRLARDSIALTVPASIINFPESGLFGYRNNRDMVIFDAGNIGPAYQPGHTHCDMLSYELMWGGERIVVDTGVCEYEPGPMRQYVRSTRAHNTVSVEGADQSEVWGEFRVARRAKILEGKISRREDGIEFIGAYRGFPALSNTIVHQRRAVLELDSKGEFKQLSIADTVNEKGAQERSVETFIHLHPDLMLEHLKAETLLLKTPSGQTFEMNYPKDVQCSREESYYCPEFGKRIPNTRIVLSLNGKPPVKISYSITKIN